MKIDAAVAKAFDLAEQAGRATSARDACDRLFDALRPVGLRALGARVYRRPLGAIDSTRLWQAGGFVVNRAPPGWLGSPGHRYICLEQNPLLTPVLEGRRRFRWTDYAAHGDSAFGSYWEAFSEAGLSDGIGLIAFGPSRRAASLSLGFERLDLAPSDTFAIEIAGQMLLEKLGDEIAESEQGTVHLTARERDCLRLVADGLTDQAIATRLIMSRTTAHAHVENAKGKLTARTRAHAVARAIELDLL